ncbi:MAG: hypothetical protein JWM76_2790 [Pseudonocardiales bacterium]|nr:hypothetical protein [Pseudonocardiales bacterium]
MSVTALALLVSAAVYTGCQWTIRIVVYPQFAKVGPAEFAGYELAHQRRVTWAVGPLFAALVISTGAVAVHPSAGAPVWTVVAAARLVVVMVVLAA